MKKQIMVRCILLCIAVVLLSGLASAAILQYNKEENVVRNMRDILTAVTLRGVPDGDYDAFAKDCNKLAFDYRVTVLDKQGNVLGDSHTDKDTMENHAGRPEVIQAVAAGSGYDKRASKTFGKNMVYVAMRADTVIYRISAPVGDINASFTELLPALFAGLLLALIVSPLLAASAAKSITRPLINVADSLQSLGTSGDDIKLMLPQYDELQPIANTINTLTHSISSTMRELADQKEKTAYLLDNMEDGLVLVDNDMRVIQINAAAQRFLGTGRDVQGRNLLVLTHQPRLIDAVTSALRDGDSLLFDLECAEPAGMVLAVHVTAIQSQWMARGSANGAVLLITDATGERQAQRMRSEFVANASHELKTPITSIGGFAELLAAGVVKEPEKVQDYLLRIKTETQRMALLIEDILKLARLEANGEGEQEQELEPVAMKQVIAEMLEGLQPQMEQRGVTAVVNAADISILAVPDDMEALVQNLLDNAVKYNCDGGKVTVTLEKRGAKLYFSVADTGIGIPYEHQSRIFERFYRVDKGRNRKAGGTGLGLAIVKHVAVKYGGEVLLQSTQGKGTVIAVTIPLGRQSLKE